MAKLQANLDAGALVVPAAEWTEVIKLAEHLSDQHTADGGHRYVAVLQLATALRFGASEFLSFDVNQRKLSVADMGWPPTHQDKARLHQIMHSRCDAEGVDSLR